MQAYQNDYEAFKAYAETHHDCVFLVDTYDTLRSGVPNAIRVAKEMGDRINFLGGADRFWRYGIHFKVCAQAA